MNSIVCFETIAAFLLGFCFICESTFTIGPNNSSVVLSGSVKLECFTTDKNYPPTWSYQKVGSDDKKDISLVFKQDGLIVVRLLNGYVQRHRIVEDRNTGEYSLLITDAKPEDAGNYTCTARGGLSEKRSAELSVFEPFPECASNITDCLGENDCHKEPDVIELSCKFRVYGNYLRNVTWMDVNHPEEALKNDSTTTDANGMASSKLIINGSYPGLELTSFRCMVTSTNNSDVNRCACHTPKINVLKITNVMESKTLEAPEEVYCTGWSKFNASGCDWFRRDYDDNGRQQETLVTSNTMLNLHRQDMKPGTYICFANCKIRGEPCRVQLLEVSYKPSGSEPVESTNVIVASVLSVLGVVALVGVAILVFFIWKRDKDSRPKTESPTSSDSSLQNQPGAPLLHGNRSSTEKLVVANGLPSKKETVPMTDVQNHCSYDIPDAKIGGITKAEKIRLMEERAEARMRANAARKGGENNPAFSPDTDVAEGVAVSERTPLLEEKDGTRMRANADKTKHE